MIITYRIKDPETTSVLRTSFRAHADVISRVYCAKLVQYSDIVTLLNNSGYTMFSICKSDIISIEP
jgi:hypothetical protein